MSRAVVQVEPGLIRLISFQISFPLSAFSRLLLDVGPCYKIVHARIVSFSIHTGYSPSLVLEGKTPRSVLLSISFVVDIIFGRSSTTCCIGHQMGLRSGEHTEAYVSLHTATVDVLDTSENKATRKIYTLGPTTPILTLLQFAGFQFLFQMVHSRSILNGCVQDQR